MITVNVWNVVERAIYEALALGLSQVSTRHEELTDPRMVVDVLHAAVMTELDLVLDFHPQPVYPTERTTSQLTNNITGLEKETTVTK